MRDLAVGEADWSFQYGSEIVYFAVRRQPLRRNSSINIHVEPEGNVLVDAPVDASRASILAAVRKHSRWIQGHVSAFLRRREHVLPREYVSGESFMYLGRRYRLKVIAGESAEVSVKLRGGHLELRLANPQRQMVREATNGWIRDRARKVFAERLDAVLADLNWKQPAPAMRLQAMQVQWGSCSPGGRLTLNPWLVKAPRDCIDYVILHELCHLKEHNHSPRFYKLLDRHMPQWRSRKNRLDELAELILNT